MWLHILEAFSPPSLPSFLFFSFPPPHKISKIFHSFYGKTNESWFVKVIRRKLVHVQTPATTTEGNIGPDAVHLLAIKEVRCFAFPIHIFFSSSRSNIICNILLLPIDVKLRFAACLCCLFASRVVCWKMVRFCLGLHLLTALH